MLAKGKRDCSRLRSTQVVPLSRPEKPKPPANMPSNCWGLLDFEKQQFGDRCPAGYTKKGLLGKGGIAVVWKATDPSGTEFALK